MTRLKALELFGFKSFADRTRFEFPEGITVVVGPNGSGKSNVVDAIKWVLGEQSVRSLRGKEMSDVIFAGSGSRKPLNYAEVSLIFDNSAGELPVEAAEVAVMRRVTRDGDSEYLVNGETSRLRDIRELFSGTGAATQAYSVIEQGRVDALLVATGRDRRAVFEEAAGITRFRARRTEALRRLERAELNRQRLADIVGEVSARLETVRHQAARARRWRTMTDRLRALRLAVSRQDLTAIDTAVADVDGALATARAELATAEAAATAATAALAELAALAGDVAPRIAAARGSAATDTQRAAAAEATLSARRARRAEVERELARAAADVAAAGRVERAAAATLAEAHAAVAARTAALDDLTTRLAACEHSARGSHDDATERRARAAAAAAVLDDRRRDRLQLESAVERASTRAIDARHAADGARQALDAARMQAARLAEAHAAWEGNIGSLDGRLEAATREVDALETEERRTAEAVQAAWHDAAGWRAKLEACRERCDVLREIVDRQEGLSDAARRLLGSGAAAVPGLAGVVADLVVVGVDWAPLVDLALGAAGNSLAVTSLDDAVHWHCAWADTPDAREVLAAGGRIGFVATDTLRDLPTFDPTGNAGVIGRLDRLVAADAPQPVEPAAARLLERLLGRAWIVERIEHALTIHPSAPAGTLFLARSGQTLTADGRLEIGLPAAAAGLVARRAELRALDARRTQLAEAVEAANAAVVSLRTELDRLRAAIHAARDRRQEAAEAVASSRAELDRVQRERRAADGAIAAAERDLRDADTRAADATADLHAARDAFAAAEPTLAAARDDVARAEAAIAALERSRGELVEEIHRLRVEQATSGEKLAAARDAVIAAETAVVSARADAALVAARHHEAEDALAAYELDLLAAGAAHAEAVVALERSAADLTALEAHADGLDARRRASSAALDDARTAASRLAERVHQHELEAGEARHQRARIVERIRDEYDIDIESADAAADPVVPADAPPLPTDRAEADREIEELRRKLASMVTVNLEALAEAEELATRLAGLETQLTDITTAKDSIGQLIARIDEESRRLLGETIETVRGHFRELFERLFGGGQADIVLEPDVDLLETAVEIVARPPGKEPRNISLLSGGEKTMTCVALLLAIFRSRPSPFCVLDEVDAALDEANVDRYVGVLRDFLGSTQFIVVTHSKKTMAAGTTLYGVTMEESGVSKRVSVRFESTAAGSVPRGSKAA